MQKLKKTLRKIGYVLLIILAGFAVGLTGGVPLIPTMGKKEDEEVQDEQVEEDMWK